jgi:phycoerythrin-associated linker protein
MDIQEFFQLCAGKWVSQRTTHYLMEQKNQSDRSDLWLDFVDPIDPEVVELCQQYSIGSSQIYGGLKIRWSEVADAYQSRFKPKKEGSALLVLVMGSENLTTGRMLRRLGTDSVMGSYSFGTDEALTLYMSINGLATEERLWFASPNLRFRSSFTQQDGAVCITSFCSEIRISIPAHNPNAEAEVAPAP